MVAHRPGRAARLRGLHGGALRQPTLEEALDEPASPASSGRELVALAPVASPPARPASAGPSSSATPESSPAFLSRSNVLVDPPRSSAPANNGSARPDCRPSKARSSEKNPSVAPPLRVSDCSQITDGAAAVVLVSGKYLDKHGIDKSKVPQLFGFGHTTDYLALGKKDAPTFSTARKAAEKAFAMANLKPRDMNGAEVHDCFSITEIVAYEILGLAEPGKGAELAKSGATALPQVRGEHVSGKIDFEIPVNAGGGLIGDGHPVGATGVRQVVDAYQQLTNQAGRAPDPGREKIPHLQHGRQPNDFRGHDLGTE